MSTRSEEHAYYFMNLSQKKKKYLRKCYMYIAITDCLKIDL